MKVVIAGDEHGVGSLGKCDQVVVGGITGDGKRRHWVGSALGEGEILNP